MVLVTVPQERFVISCNSVRETDPCSLMVRRIFRTLSEAMDVRSPRST